MPVGRQLFLRQCGITDHIAFCPQRFIDLIGRNHMLVIRKRYRTGFDTHTPFSDTVDTPKVVPQHSGIKRYPKPDSQLPEVPEPLEMLLREYLVLTFERLVVVDQDPRSRNKPAEAIRNQFGTAMKVLIKNIKCKKPAGEPQRHTVLQNLENHLMLGPKTDVHNRQRGNGRQGQHTATDMQKRHYHAERQGINRSHKCYQTAQLFIKTICFIFATLLHIMKFHSQ